MATDGAGAIPVGEMLDWRMGKVEEAVGNV